MISQTTDAGRTPTRRNTPLIETCLRVIVLSFVALTLFATPREGAAPPAGPATRVIVGSGVGGQSQVRVFGGDTAAPLPAPLGFFTALTQNPGGEVRGASCDINNDGTDDIVVGAGLGKRADVRVFNGVTGQPFPGPLGSFLAFESGFLGGVHVACGDVTGDTIPDIIAARGALARPQVRVFNGLTVAPLPPPLGSFLAFNQTFLGGVRVAPVTSTRMVRPTSSRVGDRAASPSCGRSTARRATFSRHRSAPSWPSTRISSVGSMSPAAISRVTRSPTSSRPAGGWPSRRCVYSTA